MTVRLFRVCTVLAAVALACVAYGWQVEPRMLAVREVAVQSRHEITPLRIALVSDIHAGGRGVDADRVQAVVDAVHGGAPDVVLIAGDIVNGHDHLDDRSAANVAAFRLALQPLKTLEAPLGVYAVAGNHDNWLGVPNADALYRDLGLARLDNRAEVIRGRVCLFGVADEWTGGPTADGFLACPGGLPAVGVMHNPDSAFALPSGADLLLAGHTHGGQVNLPLLGRVATSTEAGKPYAYGLSRVNGTPLFVTSGVGMSLLPVRFRAPPEVVFVELEPALG